MCSGHRLDFPKLGLFAAIALSIFAGCTQTQSPQEGLDKAIAGAGLSKENVYPLSGKVTIDGQSPQATGGRLVVLLNDPKKLDIPSREKIHVQASPQGDFAFTTYLNGDGVKPGKYILTFAMLHKEGKRGLDGPDQLKNLYNDPDKNGSIPEFSIDHQAPGKTDYAFNLTTTGKEAVSAGPHALTTLIDPHMGAH
jgi:hypothetical protein